MRVGLLVQTSRPLYKESLYDFRVLVYKLIGMYTGNTRDDSRVLPVYKLIGMLIGMLVYKLIGMYTGNTRKSSRVCVTTFHLLVILPV